MDSGTVEYLPAAPLELLRERVVSAVRNVPFYRELYAPLSQSVSRSRAGPRPVYGCAPWRLPDPKPIAGRPA